MVRIGSNPIGSFSRESLAVEAREGRITRSHRVSSDGGKTWSSARKLFPEMFSHTAPISEDKQLFIRPSSDSIALEDPAETDLEDRDAESTYIVDAVVDDPIPKAEATWFVKIQNGEMDGAEFGPMAPREIFECLNQKRISLDDIAKNGVSGSWAKIVDMLDMELANELQQHRLEYNRTPVTSWVGLVLSLLGMLILFLGPIGIIVSGIGIYVDSYTDLGRWRPRIVSIVGATIGIIWIMLVLVLSVAFAASS